MFLNKQWGEIVRMGNFMFKYASGLAFAKRYGTEICFPPHYMWDYFKNPVLIDDGLEPTHNIGERKASYDQEYFDSFAESFDYKNNNVNIMLNCFLQSPKYWKPYEDYVHEMLTFKDEIVDDIRSKYKDALSRKTIGISIRRGEFIGHEMFWQIPTEFYLYALAKHFWDWRDYNIIFFSDDREWLTNTFQGDNVYFSDKSFLGDNFYDSPMEQLIYGSLCDNFIISNSTFSWWLAYLAVNCKNNGGKVIHAGRNLTDKAYCEHNVDDYYHEDWIKSDFFEVEGKCDFKCLPTNILLKG